MFLIRKFSILIFWLLLALPAFAGGPGSPPTALPTIKINSSTGSNTQASGAGPATAVFGTAAATAANTTVTITDVGSDLSGVATDGTAALWVSSSSGKQWAKITNVSGSVGNWTVTVSDAYANTENSRTWAIGGRRATLAGSLQLGSDVRSGWWIDQQTDETLIASFNLKPNSVNNQWTVFYSSTTTRPIISTATNSVWGVDIQNANQVIIDHLSFKSTAGTPGDGIGPASTNAASYVIVNDCVIDGFRNGVTDHDHGANVDVFGLQITNSEIKNCTVCGINNWAGGQIAGCYVHNNAQGGFGSAEAGTRSRPHFIEFCVFDGNGGTAGITGNAGCGIGSQAQLGSIIRNCVFSNTASTSGNGPGLYLNCTSLHTITIENCIFYGNTKYGIQNANLTAAVYLRNNAFGSNGTSNVNGTGMTTGAGAITLTASPFVSATDFALNSTSGGGVACRQAGYLNSIFSATATAPDVGAVPTGGGGAIGGLPGKIGL